LLLRKRDADSLPLGWALLRVRAPALGWDLLARHVDRVLVVAGHADLVRFALLVAERLHCEIHGAKTVLMGLIRVKIVSLLPGLVRDLVEVERLNRSS
jgi:hypothetical protein